MKGFMIQQIRKNEFLKAYDPSRWIKIFICSLTFISFFAWLLVSTSFTNLSNDKVLEGSVDTLETVFVDPFSCSLCKDVNSIERVSKISQQMFEEKYAYSGKPVVITDGAADWKAIELFDFDFFKAFYLNANSSLKENITQYSFFKYKSDFTSLSNVLHMDEDRYKMRGNYKPWYIGWSDFFSPSENNLCQYYKKPYFLPNISEVTCQEWIFMGTPGNGAHMHIDDVQLTSWQAQIRGEKKWTIRPIETCKSDCKEMNVTLSPGEILIMDTNRWFHKTEVVPGDISIAIGSEYD